MYNHYGYSGLLVGHTNWGETSGRGVFTQLTHRAGLQGSHNGDDDDGDDDEYDADDRHLTFVIPRRCGSRVKLSASSSRHLLMAL